MGATQVASLKRTGRGCKTPLHVPTAHLSADWAPAALLVVSFPLGFFGFSESSKMNVHH